MLKSRIALMQFLQFFIWGSWLITMSAWWFGTKHWSGAQFGATFSTMGIASLFMPALAGIIADRFINAEKLFAIFHLCGAITLFCIPHLTTPIAVFWVMLLNMCFYMSTYTLSLAISYTALKAAKIDVVKEFPPIRVLGTIGFIVAMWTISLLRLETSAWMFYIASIASFTLGLYGFTLPKCPPLASQKNSSSFAEAFGLDAFKLFKNRKLALFFLFAMLLGGILQLNNAYASAFMHSFATEFQTSLAIKYPAIILSISQISEVGFIFTIPLFLKRFGIKKVIMISMFAWVLRFALFGFGNPTAKLWMILLSCIIYGMAFDFFNVSGSLYIENQVHPTIRARAQGLFVFMTNGIGAFIGSLSSGWAISTFFTGQNGTIQWQGLHGFWLVFAIYSAIIGILFTVMFKHKHTSDALASEPKLNLILDKTSA